jgi:hypothetical protein
MPARKDAQKRIPAPPTFTRPESSVNLMPAPPTFTRPVSFVAAAVFFASTEADLVTVVVSFD